MESLVAAGFDGTSEFAIPLPLAYLATPHVVVQEKVSGIQAMEIFNGDEAEKQLSAARRCGSWLGHFHMKGPQEGHLTDPGELLLSIRYWAGALQKAGEPLASKTELLVRKLEAAAPGAAVGFEPRAGHGSYMPEHVMLSGNRMVGIDLDEYDLADPARDLAWFIVSLERLGLKKRGSLRIHDRAIEEFLRTYVASGPRNALSHLSFYKAAECLHRAHRDLHGRVPPIPEWSAIMLVEGVRGPSWPWRFRVFAFASFPDRRGEGMRQRHEIDLTGGDRGRLPVQRPARPVLVEDVRAEVFPVDHGVRRFQESGNPPSEFSAHRCHPREQGPPRGVQSFRALRPPAVIGFVVSSEECQPSHLGASLVRGVEPPNPSRRVNHCLRIGALAGPDAVFHIFDDQPRDTRVSGLVEAVERWRRHSKGLKDISIDTSLEGHVASMTECSIEVTRPVLDEET